MDGQTFWILRKKKGHMPATCDHIVLALGLHHPPITKYKPIKLSLESRQLLLLIEIWLWMDKYHIFVKQQRAISQLSVKILAWHSACIVSTYLYIQSYKVSHKSSQFLNCYRDTHHVWLWTDKGEGQTMLKQLASPYPLVGDNK